jgi:hypothetical protein
MMISGMRSRRGSLVTSGNRGRIMRHFKDVWELKQSVLNGEFIIGEFTVYKPTRVFGSLDEYVRYLIELGFETWESVGERPPYG